VAQIDTEHASQIEICVSDNASMDETDLVIENLRQNCPIQLVYSKNESNIGFDANVLRVVKMARGNYCWLMGSDDIVLPGAVHYFMREIASGHDIYLCNRIDCEIDLSLRGKRFWLEPSVPSTVYDFTQPDVFDTYTRQAKSIGALYSFISSLVFKRSKWNAVTPKSEFFERGYIHVHMLLSFIQIGCVTKYCNDHLVLARADQAQSWVPTDEWTVRRILLDIDGYQMMADDLRPLSEKYHQGVLRVLRAERHGWSNLKILRLKCDPMQWPGIEEKFLKAGYSPPLIAFMRHAKPLIAFLKRLSNQIKKKKNPG